MGKRLLPLGGLRGCRRWAEFIKTATRKTFRLTTVGKCPVLPSQREGRTLADKEEA